MHKEALEFTEKSTFYLWLQDKLTVKYQFQQYIILKDKTIIWDFKGIPTVML